MIGAAIRSPIADDSAATISRARTIAAEKISRVVHIGVDRLDLLHFFRAVVFDIGDRLLGHSYGFIGARPLGFALCRPFPAAATNRAAAIFSLCVSKLRQTAPPTLGPNDKSFV